MKDETKNTEVKKEEVVQPVTNSVKETNVPEQQKRKIIIEFDNKNIDLKVADVSSYFELKGIFESILTQLK